MEKLSLSKIIKRNLDIRPEISFEPKYVFGQDDIDIDYDILLSDGTPLQRDFVWELEQKQELIMSILKGIRLPRFAVIIYNDDSNRQIRKQTFKIVDGKQRLSTIQQFMNNEFAIVVDNHGYFYNDLDDQLKMRIWNLDMRFSVIYEYQDKRLSDADLIYWFELINWAGTPQDKAHFEMLQSKIQ